MSRRPVNAPYTCTELDCNAKHEARGFCNKHYLRFKKYGNPQSVNYHRTHGKTDTPAYKSWEAMKRRCLNKNQLSYSRYGGRGITICDRWMSFENFLADMGERPTGMSIERKDNDKGYNANNCIWGTVEQQARNKGLRKNNQTGVIGIYQRETGKFVASIRYAGRQLYLGQFNSLDEASKIRQQAEKRYGYA